MFRLSIIILFTLLISVNIINTYTGKPTISNSLILFWDIHCKNSIIKYLNSNNISYKIVDYKDYNGIILKVGSNYYCLMNKHPQQYTHISILLNAISELCISLQVTSLIGISTAGSNNYKIGHVLQFNSAVIQNYKKYSLASNYTEGNKILFKSSNFINEPIIDTKGFINPNSYKSAAGEDEFVVYLVSNSLNIPSLTLTGISDHNNNNVYTGGGGQLAAENTIIFLSDNFNLI